MKIGNHTIGNREIIRRKNKLMRPSLIRIEGAHRGYGRLQTSHNSGSHSTDFPIGLQCIINHVSGILSDDQLSESILCLERSSTSTGLKVPVRHVRSIPPDQSL